METFPDIPDETPSPENVAARRELRERLEALVDTLPDGEREAVLLHYFHGLSQSEIAQIEGVPVSTISRRIGRGIEKLRPRARRAGLGDAAAALSACLAAARMLDPGAAASVSASSIFQSAAESLSASGSAGATTVAAATSGGAGAGVAIGSAVGGFGGAGGTDGVGGVGGLTGVLHSKVAVIAGVCVVGAIALLVATQRPTTPPLLVPAPTSFVETVAPPVENPSASVAAVATMANGSSTSNDTQSNFDATPVADSPVGASISESTRDVPPRSPARLAISGKVSLPDGSPAAGADVEMYSFLLKYPMEIATRPEGKTRTDTDGRFSLEINDSVMPSLVVWKGGFAQASTVLLNSEAVTQGNVVQPGLRTVTRDMVLPSASILRGVVKSALSFA